MAQGLRPILQRYQQAYSNAEQMGTLTFADVEVRLLPGSVRRRSEYAVVTGKFHLQRTTHGEAAKDDGIFSLVWHKGPQGWKIIAGSHQLRQTNPPRPARSLLSA